jgi:hypothetical protein
MARIDPNLTFHPLNITIRGGSGAKQLCPGNHQHQRQQPDQGLARQAGRSVKLFLHLNHASYAILLLIEELCFAIKCWPQQGFEPKIRFIQINRLGIKDSWKPVAPPPPLYT